MADTPIKISRGLEANIPTEKIDGNIYFCTDTGNIYIDYLDTINGLIRKQISSEFASKLRYDNENEIIKINANEVATKDEVKNRIVASIIRW